MRDPRHLATKSALKKCIQTVNLGAMIPNPWRLRFFRSYAALTISAALAILNLGGCAYHSGISDRQGPGVYRLVSVPIFKNSTPEVGVEVYFTNAMIRELERSKIAKLTDKTAAEVVLLGAVTSVRYLTSNSRVIPASGGSTPSQPSASAFNCYGGNGKLTDCAQQGAVQNTEYRILVTTALKLQRISDERILWQGSFSGERSYLAPILTLQGLDSADAPYNQSARDQNIKAMSSDIMLEAYERMTENF